LTETKKQAILFTSQSGLNVKSILNDLRAGAGDVPAVVSADSEGIGDIVMATSLGETVLKSVEDQYHANIKSIKKSTSNAFLVHLHSCYWKTGACQTRAALFVSELRKVARVNCVVTFIDNFYSVYCRIRDRFEKASAEEEDIHPIDILYWRVADMMLANMLASILDVEHFVVSVNHSMETLQKLLFLPHVAVYAGHPISDIRKMPRKDAMPLINRINNEFLVPLSTCEKLVTFVPDAIDELPFLNSTSYDNLRRKVWPNGWLANKRSIGTPLDEGAARKHMRALFPIVRRNRKIFENTIYGQISDRDYRLVRQVRNFIFTLLDRVPDSGGVEAELGEAKLYSPFPQRLRTYFFNPDNVVKRKALAMGAKRPKWATGVTGENNDLAKLIEQMSSQPPDPPLLPGISL